jgi:Ion channel
VLLFATTYFVMTHTTASGFTESLTRTDAWYFSATTLATAGYGGGR